METKKRSVYVTTRQKKKLIELITKQPKLVSCRISQEFTHADSQKLWQNIANQCNAIPGARKTWRQWRKSWQDIKSKTKKRQAEKNGQPPNITYILTEAEQEVLGVKSSGGPENTEYLQMSEEFVAEEVPGTFENELSMASLSEPDSPREDKVFTRSKVQRNSIKSSVKNSSKHSNNCYFNCDMIAVQEQRKIQIKEDYFNFKKDYLRQKLKLIKEQTEALKNIARELSK